MRSYELSVGKLGLGLDFGALDLPITFPPGHKKFFQPVSISQAEISDKASINHLYLKYQTSFLDEDTDSIIFRSETWEFGKDESGNLIFFAPYQDPPCKVVVAQDYSSGFIYSKLLPSASKIMYPLQTLEIRIFSAWLATFGDLILHASGVLIGGRGYCFIGESGAGKSTLAATLAGSHDIEILGEDQVILRFLEGQFWIFGTPWHLDPARCSPLGAPLKKVFFLDRTLPEGVEVRKKVNGVTRVLQTAFVPYYLPEYLPGILDRLALLAERVPFYTLNYRLGTDPLPLIL